MVLGEEVPTVKVVVLGGAALEAEVLTVKEAVLEAALKVEVVNQVKALKNILKEEAVEDLNVAVAETDVILK